MHAPAGFGLEAALQGPLEQDIRRAGFVPIRGIGVYRLPDGQLESHSDSRAELVDQVPECEAVPRSDVGCRGRKGAVFVSEIVASLESCDPRGIAPVQRVGARVLRRHTVVQSDRGLELRFLIDPQTRIFPDDEATLETGNERSKSLSLRQQRPGIRTSFSTGEIRLHECRGLP